MGSCVQRLSVHNKEISFTSFLSIKPLRVRALPNINYKPTSFHMSPSPHPHLPTRTAPLRLPISPLPTVHPSHMHLLSIPSSHPHNTFDPVPHCVYLKHPRPPLHPDRSLNPGCILLPRHFLFNRFLSPIGCPSQCPCLYKR